MPKRAALLVHLAAALLLASGGCTDGSVGITGLAFEPAIFPLEARLGASALMVVDSNQLQEDTFEQYELHRDRVQIRVHGNLDDALATVRSVFTVEAGRSTYDGQLRNSWMTVALFDLPTAAITSGPYPQPVVVSLEVDGEPVPDFQATLWILGSGGIPTELANVPTLLNGLAAALEPETTVRLRARGESGGIGFQTSWQIGSIELDVDYSASCLASPRAHASSEATGAGVTTGPTVASPVAGRNRVHVVLTKPKGFMVPSYSNNDLTLRGSGPIVDITFDRLTAGNCSAQALASLFSVAGVKVRERNGTSRISRPAPGEQNFDGSDLFVLYYLDPDGPSS